MLFFVDALGCNDNARITMIKAIFGETHIGSFLFHKQNEFGVALDVFNLVNKRWNGFATNTCPKKKIMTRGLVSLFCSTFVGRPI